MSDNTQPASSRRVLREKRRAEMEALLASSKEEQEAREAAALTGQLDSVDSSEGKPSAKPQTPTGKPADQPAAKPDAKPKPAVTTTASEAGKSANAAPSKPAPKDEAAPAPAPKAGEAAKAANTAKPAEAGAKPAEAGAKPAEAGSQEGDPALGERASLRRARDREALRERRRLQEEVSALTTNVPTVGTGDEPKPLTRRQLRLQELAKQQGNQAAQQSAPRVSKPSAATEGEPETTVMSVEDALAARRKLAPKPPIDPNLLGDEDHDIDLEVLAHQREMAARAAIISRRAAERERLRQENVKAGKEATSPDPFTGAMGNIRDLEDQVARSGVSGPPTASVSLELDETGMIASQSRPPAAKAASKPATRKPAAKSAPKPASAKPAAAKSVKQPAPARPTARPSKAEETIFEEVDLPRVQAVQAQGLQPLDAHTAGVRRANNMFLAMIAALAIGGIALIAGLIMMLGN